MWKIQLTIRIHFTSSQDDIDENHVMYSKSDNIENIRSDEADKVIKTFDSPKNRYQNNLQSMRGSEFVFLFTYCITNVIK